MRIRLKHFARILALLLVVTAVPVGDGAEARELNMREARRAIAVGRALPARVILRRVRADVPGEILRVALIARGRRLFYRFKILRPGGRVMRVFVNEQTAEIVRIR